MNIRLAYGKTGLNLDLDEAWNVQVVEPRYVGGLPDPLAALREALRVPIGTPPLAEIVTPGDRVGIIVNDITRATPSPAMLRAILGELAHVPRQNIILFNALGTHRANTEAELRGMLGNEVVDQYTIVQNHCFERSTQVSLGKTSAGNEIWINRELMKCSVKILTGFIEPHLFAGYSGGGKAIMPGMAGQSTILNNHCSANVSHPKATWGVIEGNPILTEIREIALRAGGTFLVNVTLNRDKQITGVYAGDLDEAHARGCAFVRLSAMLPVDQPFDIVVTTNSGYPLDLNLYQSVKGLSAAAQIVRQGGAILIATECWDGIPEHGLYHQILKEAGSPQAVLENIRGFATTQQDQWQAQIQAQIQLKAEVYVHSGHLTDELISSALLKPARSLEGTLSELVQHYGPQARICVMPEGPQTIPYVRG